MSSILTDKFPCKCSDNAVSQLEVKPLKENSIYTVTCQSCGKTFSTLSRTIQEFKHRFLAFTYGDPN